MFDIGLGEIALIAVIALFVFGPEKLPKAAADAGRMLRQVRGMAASARQDLADSAGVDLTETMDAVKSLSDLHPRNIASSLLSDQPEASKSKPTSPAPGPAFDPDAT